MFEKKWIKIKKNLVFLASSEIYYQCYNTLCHFDSSAFQFWLCDRYQGSGENQCSVCRMYIHYTFGKLESRIKKLCINLMKDLNKIVEVDPTVDFWDNFPKLEWRNTRFSDLREMIEDYFVKYFIKKFIYNKNEFQLLLLQLERLF